MMFAPTGFPTFPPHSWNPMRVKSPHKIFRLLNTLRRKELKTKMVMKRGSEILLRSVEKAGPVDEVLLESLCDFGIFHISVIPSFIDNCHIALFTSWRRQLLHKQNRTILLEKGSFTEPPERKRDMSCLHHQRRMRYLCSNRFLNRAIDEES